MADIESATSNSKPIPEDPGLLKWDPLNAFKNIYSTCLLIFSITIIMGLIATQQTDLSSKTTPMVTYLAIWAGILWLTILEGSQCSLVGLAPVSQELYKDSHPIAFLCTKVTTKGDNLGRFLMGRQFMACVIIFLINVSGEPTGDVELWGLPQAVKDIFFSLGLAMVFFTSNWCLNSQVNASVCMLDYCNDYFVLFTVWVAMGIEFSGLLHASYLIEMVVIKCAGQVATSKEEPRNVTQSLFFWFRCFISFGLLCFCIAVTLTALFTGQTTLSDGIKPTMALLIFFQLLFIVGMLEGMQVAFFAVSKFKPSERGHSVFAKKTCELLFSGNNLPGCMIGRQLSVVCCMFFVARATSVSIKEGGDNFYGVSDSIQTFFNAGLLGALMLTIVSIAWQLIASAFPLAFLSNPLTYVLLRVTLFIEMTGICSGAWVLAAIHAKIAGFQRDEVYIGTGEEGAKKN